MSGHAAVVFKNRHGLGLRESKLLGMNRGGSPALLVCLAAEALINRPSFNAQVPSCPEQRHGVVTGGCHATMSFLSK